MAVNTFRRPSKAHLFSRGSGSCTWCCSSCWPLATLDFYLPKRRLTESGPSPRLASKAPYRQQGGGAELTDASPSSSSTAQPVTLQSYLRAGVPPPPTGCQEEVRVQTSIIITDISGVLHLRLNRNKNILNASLEESQLDHLTRLLLHILYE